MKIKDLNNLILLTIIAISFMFSSCATKYNYVYPDSLTIEMEIKPGDDVKITTIDAKEHEFEVVEITDDAIVGENQKVHFDDVLRIHEKTDETITSPFVKYPLYALLITFDVAAALGGSGQAIFIPNIVNSIKEQNKENKDQYMAELNKTNEHRLKNGLRPLDICTEKYNFDKSWAREDPGCDEVVRRLDIEPIINAIEPYELKKLGANISQLR